MAITSKYSVSPVEIALILQAVEGVVKGEKEEEKQREETKRRVEEIIAKFTKEPLP